MRLRLLILVLICALPVTAQQPAPAPGVVHGTVTVAADHTNSYALYLPSNYSPARRWPLLLVFDPFARGEVGVKLFHEGAEKYGFIVAGSNNSRNFEDPSNAIRLLWADVKERYSVDPRRIYVAGLSGGARVASSIALACKNCIAGVIANGAGLPQGATAPGPEVADWFLVAGTTDFNYPELLHLKDALDARSDVSRFVVYDGPHNWMPPDYAERAVAWLQLRAMIKGLAPVDKDFVNRQFDLRQAEAQSLEKSGDVLAATRAYHEIATDFRAFREVAEQEARSKSLRDSEDFRKATKNEKAALDLQDETAKRVGDLVAGINQQPDNRSAFFSQLQSEANDVHRKQQHDSSPARRQAVARGLASAFAYAFETGQQAMLKKDYIPARDMFQAGETIMPDSPLASYLVATAEAQLGNKKQAIDELKKALEKGMTNAKLLDDPAFDRIREDQGFKQIVVKISEKQNAYH